MVDARLSGSPTRSLAPSRATDTQVGAAPNSEFELGVLHDFVLGMVVVEWSEERSEERSEEVLGSPKCLTSVLVRVKELKPEHGLRCH